MVIAGLPRPSIPCAPIAASATLWAVVRQLLPAAVTRPPIARAALAAGLGAGGCRLGRFTL
jgi:hypothetical protein